MRGMKEEGVLAQHQAGGERRRRRKDRGEEVKHDGSICLDMKRCHVLS